MSGRRHEYRVKLSDLLSGLFSSSIAFMVLALLFNNTRLVSMLVFLCALAGLLGGTLLCWTVWAKFDDRKKRKKRQTYKVPRIDEDEECKVKSPIAVLTKTAESGDVDAQKVIETYAVLEVRTRNSGDPLYTLRSEYTVKFQALESILESRKTIESSGSKAERERVNDLVTRSSESLVNDMTKRIEDMNSKVVSDIRANANYLTDGHLQGEVQESN